MTPEHIDTSNENYADTLRAAHEAYEKYLRTGESADLQKWVLLDREVSRIRDARQKAAQREGRELRLRVA